MGQSSVKRFSMMLVLTCITTSAEAETRTLDPSGFTKITSVDPRFQSYNVEMAEIIGGRFWAPYPKTGEMPVAVNTQQSGGLALEAALFRQRPPVDLKQKKLRNLARALGPVYIRVSGSWANTTYFQDDDRPSMEKPPKGFQNVMTRQQWAGVLDFAKAVNGRIVTSFAVSSGARDADGIWKPDEALKLIRRTKALGGRIYAAELINEPNLGAVSGLPSKYDEKTFAKDIDSFSSFIKADAPEIKIVGPGSTGETGVALFSSKGLSTDAMLSAAPRAKFDYFSYHFYGGRSQRCARMAPASGILVQDALGEEWLGRTDKAYDFYSALRDRHMPGAPIWLTETAQASCGGDKWASSFADSFRYLDQMGRLARRGVSAIFHNTLAASDYGLIDEATLEPRPNYWAALLWRRVMGSTVLDAGSAPDGVHIYAHCLNGRALGVGMVLLNLDPNAPKSVNVGESSKRFTLTSSLMSETVMLNGEPLKMKGNRLPKMRPYNQSAGQVELPPGSITFLEMTSAKNPECALNPAKA